MCTIYATCQWGATLIHPQWSLGVLSVAWTADLKKIDFIIQQTTMRVGLPYMQRSGYCSCKTYQSCCSLRYAWADNKLAYGPYTFGRHCHIAHSASARTCWLSINSLDTNYNNPSFSLWCLMLSSNLYVRVAVAQCRSYCLEMTFSFTLHQLKPVSRAMTRRWTAFSSLVLQNWSLLSFLHLGSPMCTIAVKVGSFVQVASICPGSANWHKFLMRIIVQVHDWCSVDHLFHLHLARHEVWRAVIPNWPSESMSGIATKLSRASQVKEFLRHKAHLSLTVWVCRTCSKTSPYTCDPCANTCSSYSIDRII